MTPAQPVKLHHDPNGEGGEFEVQLPPGDALRPGLLATFMAVASFVSSPTDTPELTHSQIAKRRDRSPHTVRKQLYELKALGVIDAVTVYRDGAAVCVRYTIHYQHLLELAGMGDGIKCADPEVDPLPEADPPDEEDTPQEDPPETTDPLVDRIRVLADAWHEVAGRHLDLRDEILNQRHQIPYGERHADGRLKGERQLFTCAQYIAFALKQDPLFADKRRRIVSVVIRQVAETVTQLGDEVTYG